MGPDGFTPFADVGLPGRAEAPVQETAWVTISCSEVQVTEVLSYGSLKLWAVSRQRSRND
jgi:hypothetical protein